MKLLDLPQELFDEVITHCVTDNGVAASWKIRSTCKTFCSAISQEIFAKRPIKALLEDDTLVGDTRPKNDTAGYLAYPLRSLYEARPYLPDFFGRAISLSSGKPMGHEALFGIHRVSAEDNDMLREALRRRCLDTWMFLATMSDEERRANTVDNRDLEADEVKSLFRLLDRTRKSLL